MIAQLLLLLASATPKPANTTFVQCAKPATVQECSARLDSLADEIAFMQKVLEGKGIDFAKERQRLALADSVFQIPHDPALILGPANAKHTLAVFTDPQCPYCTRLYPQLDAWLSSHPDLRVAIHLYPLSFHERAQPASQAYWAAAQQRKFVPFFRALHANGSKDLSDSALDKAAQAALLDVARFRRDLESDQARKAVDDDKALGNRIGVEGTPSLYLDGRATRDPDADLAKLKR